MTLHSQGPTMDGQDVSIYRSTAPTANHVGEDGEVVDEPPDRRHPTHSIAPEFHKSAIRPQSDHNESLLTRAFRMGPTSEKVKPDICISTELARRRSSLDNASASTADLTSDGGITSPARTETPSPKLPTSTYVNFADFTLDLKPVQPSATVLIQQDPKESIIPQLPAAAITKPDPAVEALVRKRCISFACAQQKPKSPMLGAKKTAMPAEPETEAGKIPPKRTIKFDCAGPRFTEKSQSAAKNHLSNEALKLTPPESYVESSRCKKSQPPSSTTKLNPAPPTPADSQRDSSSTSRRTLQSPVPARSRRPTYIAADEEALRPSEATRFHEFASDEIEEDDWIRKDISETCQKLTINDTLKKENAIRQLGKEAEEEALQDDEEEEDAEDSDEDEDEDNSADEEGEEDTVEGSDLDASDGNETDNEEGFADSDDESDATGDFQFWAPRKSTGPTGSGNAGAIRNNRRRTTSESSIDSLSRTPTSLKSPTNRRPMARRHKASRKIKILPGTPDLPDSTDFVCGTLDEDRPIEYAYASCMKAREKHYATPQDIDPSFPTSDLEDEDEDEVIGPANDSDEVLWLHGKFEDDDDGHARRRSRSMRKSPNHSPKKLHSPPPKRYHSPLPGKQRLRSPPPRRPFGYSPGRTVRSPATSPTNTSTFLPLAFAPLGQRQGPTHTKSLPRTPNVFSHQYHVSRFPILDDAEGGENINGYTRGAIDIVKGLEQKRLRRKEKLYQKQYNRVKRSQPERKPQPGKGAERMREIGLLMAGKLGRTENCEYMWSA